MKVVKFGGSSMADAGQYRKVRDILLADPDRQVVIVSAAGKRHGGDHKLTDLLYLCYSHVKYGVDPSLIFDRIMSRYLDIQKELELYDLLRHRITQPTTMDEAVTDFMLSLHISPRRVREAWYLRATVQERIRTLAEAGELILDGEKIFPAPPPKDIRKSIV